jgi:hypothetical protein
MRVVAGESSGGWARGEATVISSYSSVSTVSSFAGK